MSASDESPWDILSSEEARFDQHALDELADQGWATNLIAGVQRNGGLTRDNKGLLFELRFAYALHLAGIVPSYEVPGEGNSTLDFGFTSAGQEWVVELMRLEETAAVKNATQTVVETDGVTRSTLHLSTDADDSRQSIEGEIIKAVQRICQKCERAGHPYKFPVPNGAYQVLLVDIRNFLDGVDNSDLISVALGGEHVREGGHRYIWEGQLISGVFNPRTDLRGAEHARQRVHFIGFVSEEAYEPGEFGKVTRFVTNPLLFVDADAVRTTISTWPLQPINFG